VNKDITILGAATVSGGIPDDLQKGIIQITVGLVTWLITRLFDKFNRLGK